MKNNKNMFPKPLVSGPALYMNVLKLLENEKRGKILDAPAGQGALSEKLKNLEFEVYSLDIDLSNFKVRGVDTRRVDLNRELPYENSFFDYVVSVEGIEHLENPWHLIREFSRVLKKGGKLIITTPNCCSLYSRALFFARGNFLWFENLDDKGGHINPIFFPEIKLILTSNKFKIEKITNEQEFIKKEKKFNKKLIYYYVFLFEKVFNTSLIILHIIYEIINKFKRKNKELTSFKMNEFISNEKIVKGDILIIKAIKQEPQLRDGGPN